MKPICHKKIKDLKLTEELMLGHASKMVKKPLANYPKSRVVQSREWQCDSARSFYFTLKEMRS